MDQKAPKITTPKSTQNHDTKNLSKKSNFETFILTLPNTRRPVPAHRSNILRNTPGTVFLVTGIVLEEPFLADSCQVVAVDPLDELAHVDHPARDVLRAARLVLAEGAPGLVEKVESENSGVLFPLEPREDVAAVQQSRKVVFNHALDSAVGPKLVRLRDGQASPLDVGAEPVADVRGQPHVDGDEQDADPTRARDGVDVIESTENLFVVLPGGSLEHEAGFFSVSKDADEVETGVFGLVENLGDVVVSELLYGSPGGGVSCDAGGLPVEVDPS